MFSLTKGTLCVAVVRRIWRKYEKKEGGGVLRDSLQKRCDLFIHNRDTIKSAFGWESAYMYPLCANIYSSKGLQADAAQMKKSREILKKRTSLFSNFRGTSKMAIISMLSVSTFPEQQMEQMLLAYNALKSVFWGSEYLSVAAAVLAEMADPNQYGKIAQRTRAIYNRMKKRHPFLTSGEDSTLAALLAFILHRDFPKRQYMA